MNGAPAAVPRSATTPGSGPRRDADLEALLGARVAAHLAPRAGELDAARGIEDAQVDVGPLPGDLREGALGEADLEVAVGGAQRVSEQVVLHDVEVVGADQHALDGLTRRRLAHGALDEIAESHPRLPPD